MRAMSPAQRRGETFEALRRLLVHAGQQRPRVLVIEDLHWIVGLGHLDAARGRREEAREHYRAAWAIISGLRARTQDPELRAGLLSSPLILEVEDLARRG